MSLSVFGQRISLAQAHQAHVHTIENKSAKKENTVEKKSEKQDTSAKSKIVKSASSPKPKQTKIPRSQTDERRKLTPKKINVGPAVAKPGPEQTSDPMLYVAIAVFVMFLAFSYKLFLT